MSGFDVQLIMKRIRFRPMSFSFDSAKRSITVTMSAGEFKKLNDMLTQEAFKEPYQKSEIELTAEKTVVEKNDELVEENDQLRKRNAELNMALMALKEDDDDDDDF